MNHSESLTKIAPALVAALAHIGGAKKGKTNPHFKNTYASLENVILASKEILAENGLALLQFPTDCVSGVLHLETVFVHDSGEWIGAEMGIAIGSKVDPQGVGSALTYARRYAQMSALNMPAVDDDGERALGRVDGKSIEPASPTRKTSAQANRDGDNAKLKEEIGKLDRAGLAEWRLNFEANTAHLPRAWLDPVSDMLYERLAVLDAPAELGEMEAEMDRAFAETVR